VLPKLVTCTGANLGKGAYPITAALASSNSAPIPSRQPHPHLHLTWQAPHRPQLEAPACAKLGVRMTGNNRIIIYGREADGTDVVEFRTARLVVGDLDPQDPLRAAISIARSGLFSGAIRPRNAR
jgi:hypothetical protein